MGEGSMFEEPDFSRAEPATAGASEDAYDEDDDVEDDEVDEDDEGDDEGASSADGLEEGDEDDEDDDEDDDAEAGEVYAEGDAAGDEDDEDDDEDDEDATVNRVQGAAARAVLEHVTRALVDDPDSVVVEVSEGRSGLRFSVHVAQGDMGRLIGRKGRTAQAIRTLVRAAAASEGTEASVDIVD
ncbi:MAG: KH domain-containing protein [Acidimicrobiales bacterium]|jgi:predicted RNA-binding protein YlqC (UPF0109 family)